MEEFIVHFIEWMLVGFILFGCIIVAVKGWDWLIEGAAAVIYQIRRLVKLYWK